MDAADFDRWYDAAYPRIVGHLTALLGSRAEAQDCVQEAFIRAWDRRLDLEVEASRDAWVRTTAYRLGVSRWRRIKRGLDLGARGLRETTEATSLSDIRADLVAALRKIPEGQRHVVVLHYLADRTIAQIAAELGIAEGTVKARLHHARHALADLLTDTTTGAST